MSEHTLAASWQRLLRGTTWSGTLGVSLAAIGIGAVVIGASSRSFVGAITQAGVNEPDPDIFAPLVELHQEASELAKNRFIGRSAFFLPPPPPQPAPPPRPYVPPPPPPEPPPEIHGPPAPPPPPASYEGPNPVGIMGTTVLFDGGSPVQLGEEVSGVKVLSIDPPWMVRLAHKGGEYDVDLTFRRDMNLFSTPLPTGDAAVGFFAPSSDSAGASTPGGSSRIAGRSTPTRQGARSAPGARTRGGERATEQPAGDDNKEEDPPPRDTGENGTRGPLAGSDQSPPTEGSAISGDIPAALSDSQIDSMTREEAMAAIQAVIEARKKGEADEATKERLAAEYVKLQKRLKAS